MPIGKVLLGSVDEEVPEGGDVVRSSHRDQAVYLTVVFVDS